MGDTSNLSIPTTPLQASELNERLLYAALNGHPDTLKDMLAKGTDINTKSSSGYTPLMLAAGNGHTTCVEILLSSPAILVNTINLRGNTALMRAARFGRVEVILKLIDHPEILVNQSNKHGATALMLATRYNHLRAIEALLTSEDIDVNQATPSGITAMTEAFLQLNRDIGKILAEHGATYPENAKSPRQEMRTIQPAYPILDTPITTLTFLSQLKIAEKVTTTTATTTATATATAAATNTCKPIYPISIRFSNTLG